jgi:hypothetical protein
MYGTIMRSKVKKECVRDLYALGKEWDASHRKRAVGYISSEILWEDQEEGRICMIVHFTNKEQYFKNAASPEQHEFYLRIRDCLETEPVWIDGYFDRWDTFYSRPPAFLAGAEPEKKETTSAPKR